MPLYQRPDLVATKNNLVNYGSFGFANVDYTAIGFKKLDHNNSQLINARRGGPDQLSGPCASSAA